MAPLLHFTKPGIGMTYAFSGDTPLADIPAKVIHIWPRFRSGDYLVTLQYNQPVKFHNQWIRHIDAFVSELYQPVECKHKQTDYHGYERARYAA